LNITEKCTDEYDNGHGSVVANIVGGLTNGVASKANIYGFTTQSSSYDSGKSFARSLLQGLEHINSRYLNENNPENVKNFIHKSVINMSCGYYLSEKNDDFYDKEDFTDYFGQLIKKMSNKGTVFVAAAGNNSTIADNDAFPCSFDDVICVGATDNIGINDEYNALNEIYKHENDTSVYPNHDEWNEIYEQAKTNYSTIFDKFFKNKFVLSKSYRRAYFSNYGKKVDIYAPGFVKAFYKNGIDEMWEGNWYGTSFSSPIVAGVAATIMSENPNKNYTTREIKMELQRIGLKNIIEDVGEDLPNIFINNGKHLRYNFDNGDESELDIEDLECFSHGCCLRN